MRRLLLVLVAVAALLSLAACGIEADSSPRALDEDDVPEALAATTTTSTAPGSDVPTRTIEVSFLSNEVLRASPREVEVRAGITGAIEALLAGPSEAERSANITTSIPAGTELLDVQVSEDGDLLTLDFSEELGGPQGSELRNAVAQIVYTATAFNGDEDQQVRFQIDGQVRSVPANRGATAPVVTRADYRDLDPAADPDG